MSADSDQIKQTFREKSELLKDVSKRQDLLVSAIRYMQEDSEKRFQEQTTDLRKKLKELEQALDATRQRFLKMYQEGAENHHKLLDQITKGKAELEQQLLSLSRAQILGEGSDLGEAALSGMSATDSNLRLAVSATDTLLGPPDPE